MSELKKPAALQFRHNRGEGFVAGYEKEEMDKYLSEVDKVISELKADYDEVRGRLQTANLIKDEQLTAARHHKYKRCLAMAEMCAERRMYWTYRLQDDGDKGYSKDYKFGKNCFWRKWCVRWLELADKFK